MVMTTRNLNFKQGLVGGQKAIVCAFSTSVVHVQLIDPDSSLVLILRIRFQYTVGRNDITFSRISCRFACAIPLPSTIVKDKPFLK